MRDYLKLYEIESILAKHFTPDEVYEVMANVYSDAETCLCAASSYSECCCGAWEPEDDIDL